MSSPRQSVLYPKDIVRVLITRAPWWVIPTVVVAVLAAAYASVRPATWEASQALMVRNEAVNNRGGLGKFNHSDELKGIQETMLEVVRSRGVLKAALEEVGPPADFDGDPAAWPSDRNVAGLRGSINLTPPKGAEFGSTEVFYLKVKDGDRERAAKLSEVLSDKLQSHYQQLRDAKAQSMVDELADTVRLAKDDLDESTARLTEMEKQVGSDLAELRALADSGNGDSTLRRTISEIRGEIRQARAAEAGNRQLLSVLREAQTDPGRLVAAPSSLLASQPALRRLKEGLIDAQIKTAGLRGRMTDEHPLVRSARECEEEIGRHLHSELAIAVRGLEIEFRLSAERLAMLDGRLTEATGRLEKLAVLRADYSNRVAETANRTRLVEQAEQNLAEARASVAAAKAASLISRLDTPDTGTSPVGASRAMIVLAGIVGGLVTGFGLLFLTVQPAKVTAPEPSLSSAQPIEPAAEPSEPPRLQPARTQQGSAEEPRQPVRPAKAPKPAAPTPPPLPSLSRAVETKKPAAEPVGSLSFKQALKKIHYGSTV